MRLLWVLCAMSSTALAGPVDPDKLPALAAPGIGRDISLQLWTTGVLVDDLLQLVGSHHGYIKAAEPRTVQGRVSPARPRDLIMEAVTKGSTIVTPVKGKPGASTSFVHTRAPAREVVATIAGAANVDWIYAVRRPTPEIVLRISSGEPAGNARAVAKLAGIEMIEKTGLWIFVDPGAKLDPAVAARVTRGARIRLLDATPGEASTLLDPKAAPGRCPPGVRIDARLRAGQIGYLEAILATLDGPACGAAPAKPTWKQGKLVGLYPEAKRAVFHFDTGGAVFLVTAADDITPTYVSIGKTDGVDIEARRAPESSNPCSTKAGPQGWVLRATSKTSANDNRAWKALLVDKAGRAVRLDGSDTIVIARDKVTCPDGGPTYVLSAP